MDIDGPEYHRSVLAHNESMKPLVSEPMGTSVAVPLHTEIPLQPVATTNPAIIEACDELDAEVAALLAIPDVADTAADVNSNQCDSPSSLLEQESFLDLLADACAVVPSTRPTSMVAPSGAGQATLSQEDGVIPASHTVDSAMPTKVQSSTQEDVTTSTDDSATPTETRSSTQEDVTTSTDDQATPSDDDSNEYDVVEDALDEVLGPVQESGTPENPCDLLFLAIDVKSAIEDDAAETLDQSPNADACETVPHDTTSDPLVLPSISESWQAYEDDLLDYGEDD